MSPRRTLAIFRRELAENFTRPLFWTLVLLVIFITLAFSGGHMTIRSGDTSVGGNRAWITSEFANANIFSLTIFLFYSFFLAVAAGMSVIRDDELKVGELLHATAMRPSEYVWGKFSAIMLAFLAVLGLNLVFSGIFNHLLPNADADKIRGPFAFSHYLRPALVFGVPPLIFIGGITFAVGERTRKPILVFVLPVGALLVTGFFLWNWSPGWLDPRVNRLLGWLDPAGFRWLNETWLKVDRGVAWYNTHPVGLDAPFLVSRLVFVALGIVPVALSARHLDASVRGSWKPARGTVLETARPGGMCAAAHDGAAASLLARERTLRGLEMRARPPGFLRTMREVARVEARELWSQPGMYLFVPIILLQIIGTSLTAVGAFGTEMLVTPGTIAVNSMNTVTLLVCLLLLFYTVESLLRERHTGLAPIYFSTPGRTPAFIAGKMLSTAMVGVVILAATLLAAAIAIAVQHRVAFNLGPFLVVWGLALLPTFLLWNAFVMMTLAAFRNRYTTYGAGVAALIVTGAFQARHHMNWVGNWDLWGALQWSDMGTFELSRGALALNRMMALGLAALFGALAVSFYPRRDGDAIRTSQQLGPGAIWRRGWKFALLALVPVVCGFWLYALVDHGFQGETEKKREKDYWKQNLATWKDAPVPAIRHVDLDLTLDPAKHAFTMDGSYLMGWDGEKPLARFALTTGLGWRDLAWTVNGGKAEPEKRTGLYVITPPAPLARGDTVRVGFQYHGVFPKGVTKNGGGTMEFILPSGVVLTSFTPSFVPVPGFQEDIGVDDKNRYEPKQYPDDFYLGPTPAAFGNDTAYTTRIRITAPAEYTLNSVGTLAEETVSGGKRTALWVSDHPVRFFNVVAGKWAVRRGEGTAIYYHPSHTYNLEEMSAALEGARRWYSEWFLPFPWKELKLSEFPALSSYAQGFPTDITFSEGIGFLTKNDPKAATAFWVTAHESAHQWWGNILTPGKGPNGDLLSEGMAHFSTMLLLEQVKGARYRIEFAKRVEEHYGDERHADAERRLTLIDESKEGDEAVTYDKGGWVFWMLLNLMGRERGLAGYHHFIAAWSDSTDHPVLQDFIASMRPFAPDSAAFDAFVQQWFYQVVVPEYRLERASKSRLADGSGWEASVLVRNIGTGIMPVEVAASHGKRWEEKGGYEDARVSVRLAAGDSSEVRIHSKFEPEQIVIDPDAKVLQLRRKDALARL